MTEEESAPGDLEVLGSIYPEAKISSSSISLDIHLEPKDEVAIKLVSSEKTVKGFKTEWFEPLHFKVELPLISGVFHLESKWLGKDVLQSMETRLEEIRTDLKENDSLDLLSYTIMTYLTVELIEEFYKQIFPSDGIVAEDPNHYNLLKGLSETLRFTNFQEMRFECNICLDAHDGTNGILLNCDHAFCKKCFKKYALRIMKSSHVTTLQCPDCPIVPLKNLGSKSPHELRDLLFTVKVTLKDLSQVFEPKVVEKYEHDRLSGLFETYSKYYPFSCSQCPRCMKFGFRDDLDDMLVVCRSCKLAYCYQCHHSWHGKNNYCRSKLNTIPLNIISNLVDKEMGASTKLKYEQKFGRENLRKAINDYIADQAFAKAVEEDDSLVKCPQCSTVITKMDGCHKMKCPLCSTNFCYRCSIQLDAIDPYIHYSDPRSPCFKLLFEDMPGT